MNDNTRLTEYVTFTAAGQLFGLPIERVQDVFKPSHITRVPLAGPEIAGVLNLRGRIVTAIHLSNRLDLQAHADAAAADGDRHRTRERIVRPSGRCGGRSARSCRTASAQSNPINLDRKLARVSAGVFRLDGQLLVVLDVDRVLDLGAEAAAA